jgi:predicted GNAT family acetyltransferase
MAHEVRHNADQSRYELRVDDHLVGIADYRAHGSVLTFPHTVIVGHMRGRGLGSELVRAALDDVRRRGATVVPTCWYVAEFIDAHPEYGDLLAS